MRRLTGIVAVAIGGSLLLVGIFLGFWGQDASSEIAGNAGVVGAIAGVGSLMVAALAVLPARSPASVSIGGAAERRSALIEDLATETLHRWAEQSRVRGLSTASALVVRYRVLHGAPGAVPAAAGSAVAGPSAPLTEEAVDRLHDELYRPLLGRGGTVVIVGAAGAGKTSAMVLLLLAALRGRDRRASPLPVWAALTDWDPAQRLDDWVTGMVQRDFPDVVTTNAGGAAEVRRLVRDRGVTLFLDGLDEMPPEWQRRALDRIDQEASLLTVVLSSRYDEYRTALAGRATDSSVLQIEDPETEDAYGYLRAGWFPDQRERWQAVVQHMQDNPDGPVSRTLRTPLMLALAREAYVHGDPREMLGFATGSELEQRLFAGFIEAAYPDPDERLTARRWLSWIAAALRGGRTVRWWEIPEWFPRGRLFATATLLLAPVVGLPTGMVATVGFGTPTGPLLGFGAALVLAPVYAAIGIEPERAPGSLRGPVRWMPKAPRPKLMSSGERLRRIAVSIAGGMLSGLFFVGVMWLSRHTLEWALLGLGLPAGVVFALASTLEEPTWQASTASSVAAAPAEVYRYDLRLFAAKFAAMWIGVALLAVALGYFYATVATDFGFGRWSHLVGYGALTGMVAMIPFLCVAGGFAPGVRMVLIDVSRLLTSGGADRTGLMRQLQIAARRQLLRQVGTTYQFRHVALQDYLASQVNTLPPLLAPVPRDRSDRKNIDELHLAAEREGDADSALRLGERLAELGMVAEAIDAVWVAVRRFEEAELARSPLSSPKLFGPRSQLLDLLQDETRRQRAAAGRGELTERAAEFAQAYLTIGNLQVASYGTAGKDEELASYREGLKLAPENADLHRCVAEVLAENDELDAAEKAYRTSLRLDDTDAVTYLGLGNVLLRQGSSTEAARHYELAVRSTPIAPLGESVVRYGHPAETHVAYRSYYDLVPHSGHARKALGDVLLRRHDWPGAHSAYRSATYRFGEETRSNPADAPAAYVGLGDAHRALDEVSEAIRAYRTALAAAPHDVGARCGLAQALLVLERPEEAEEVLVPERADDRTRRPWGLVQGELGRYAVAEPVLREVLRTDPDDGLVRLALAELYAERGDDRRAEHEYRQAIPTLVEPGAAFRGLAEILSGQERDDEAEDVYRLSIASGFGDRLLYLDLADVLARRGRQDEAAEYRDPDARRRFSNDSSPFWAGACGRGLNRTLRLRDQEATARVALDEGPGRAAALLDLAMIQVERGRFRTAIRTSAWVPSSAPERPRADELTHDAARRTSQLVNRSRHPGEEPCTAQVPPPEPTP